MVKEVDGVEEVKEVEEVDLRSKRLGRQDGSKRSKR